MFGVLESIYHGIISIPYWIAGALIEVLNAIILTIAAVVAAALSLLPAMPTRPAVPEDGVVGMINFLLPLEGWLAIAIASLAALVTFFVIRWLLSIARFS